MGYAGAYYVGVLRPAHVRDIDRPAAEVATALESLDIRREPGAPGTDPARSGGIMPVFRHERTATGLVWTVMSGDKVATQMFADLTPLDGGRRTRVDARVDRGDAPDAFVSPTFRSEALTRMILVGALRNALDDMELPHADAETCARLVEQLAGTGFEDPHARDTLGKAIGATMRATLQASAQETEMRRRGCRPDFRDHPFPRAQMTP
jgi:hypothetical protein